MISRCTSDNLNTFLAPTPQNAISPQEATFAAAAKQEMEKGEVKREKSTEPLRQPQLIACSSQCSETADENMSV